MRNLKKVLALVLALMMTVSLMATASAATYNDSNDIAQDEAVEVMSALGIFNGTDGNNFDPDGNLTRAQAAKIITYMMLGQTVADALPNTGSKFTDCADGRWYVGAVNYLTDLGIVAGRSDTVFDPNGNVNGYEFAKMLLGALGYNSKFEKFEGDSAWSINIATTARRAGLDEGLAVSVLSSLPITREQAAKLAFNTLTADMVYYEGGVSVGDVTVNPTRHTVSNAKSNDYNVKVADRDEYMQFCEQYFPTLKFNVDYGTPDAFGRAAAGQWLIGKDVAYTNVAEPALVVTEKLSENALTALLPKGVSVKNNSVTIKANGANGDTVTSLASLASKTASGKTVEIYIDADNKIDAVVTVEYKVETIDNITEKNGTTTYKFSTSGNKSNTEDTTNVILMGGVVKGDVVTTATVGGKVYVYPTTSFTGSQTATKTTGGVQTVTIGGEKYVVSDATGVSAFTNSADTLTYYVDFNGYLVKAEGADAPAPEYGVIVSSAIGQSAASLDNPSTYTVIVRMVLADGSIADYTLATAVTTEVNQYGTTSANGSLVAGSGNNRVLVAAASSINQSTVDSNLNGKLFAYTVNNKGELVISNVATPDSTLANNAAGQVALTTYNGANNAQGAATQSAIKVLFTNSTTFVLYHTDANGKWVTEATQTGISGLSLNDASGIAVVTGNGSANTTATVVFLNTASVAETTDEYVFISNPASSYTTVLIDGDEFKTWTGIAPDGSEVDVYLDSTTDVASLKSGLYTYDTDKMLDTSAKVNVEDADTTISSSDLYANILGYGASVTGNLLNLTGSTYVNITEDTQIVYLDSELDSVAGNKCLIVMEAAATPTNVATIYVFAEGDKPAIDATIASTAEIANNVTTTTISVTGITAEAEYEITARSADTNKATVSVSGTTVTVTRVGEAPASASGDDTVTVTVTVTPTGGSANSLSAKSVDVTVTLKAADPA